MEFNFITSNPIYENNHFINHHHFNPNYLNHPYHLYPLTHHHHFNGKSLHQVNSYSFLLAKKNELINQANLMSTMTTSSFEPKKEKESLTSSMNKSFTIDSILNETPNHHQNNNQVNHHQNNDQNIDEVKDDVNDKCVDQVHEWLNCTRIKPPKIKSKLKFKMLIYNVNLSPFRTCHSNAKTKTT